jgi:phospholipid-binding lipoprotein MlaA
MQRAVRAPLLGIACLLLFGCASIPNGQRDPRDPWERLNRTTFKVNDAVDRAVTKPIAKAYARVTPAPVRTGVSNFMDNLTYPITIVNDLLQLKFKPFGQDIARLTLNTTVGIGGIFDPASRVGLQKNDQDLGLTFGHWGAKPGPYFVIPILGPSDVRDGLGRVGDIWLTPTHYIQNNYISYSLWGVELVDTRYRLLDTEKLLEGVYDRYAFLRNAYLQRREFLINNGRNNEQQDKQQFEDENKILEESEGPADQPGKSPETKPPPRESQPGPQPTPDAPPK